MLLFRSNIFPGIDVIMMDNHWDPLFSRSGEMATFVYLHFSGTSLGRHFPPFVWQLQDCLKTKIQIILQPVFFKKNSRVYFIRVWGFEVIHISYKFLYLIFSYVHLVFVNCSCYRNVFFGCNDRSKIGVEFFCFLLIWSCAPFQLFLSHWEFFFFPPPLLLTNLMKTFMLLLYISLFFLVLAHFLFFFFFSDFPPFLIWGFVTSLAISPLFYL